MPKFELKDDARNAALERPRLSGVDQRAEPGSSTRADVERATSELVEVKRRWCRQQAPLWRRIPEAAIAADGITGYTDRHSYAYHQGFWQLYSSTSVGHYRVYVDLSNGELIDA